MTEQTTLVHWIGEHNNTLHGNGAGSKDMEHTSGDEDEVTCRLCHTLLARRERDSAEHSSRDESADDVTLTEGEALADECYALDRAHGSRLRAALANPPTLAQHDAEVRARTLREAADAWWARTDIPSRFETWSWLRARADALTTEGGQP